MNKFLYKCLLWLLGGFLFAASGGAQTVSLVESTPPEYLLQFELKDFHFSRYTVEMGGDTTVLLYPDFEGAIVLPMANHPLLPFCSFSLWNPAEKPPEVRILASQVTVLDSVDLGKFPMEVGLSEKDTESAVVCYNGAQVFRGLRIHSFRLCPFEYDDQMKQLRVYTSLKMKILFQEEESEAFASVFDLEDRDLLRGCVLNSEQIPERPFPKLSGKKLIPRTWYDPNQEYYKILVSRDGLYRITGDDLERSGVSLSDLKSEKINLYYKGRPVPIYVADGQRDGYLDREDFIEFVGFRNAPGRYQRDAYSDTSVYWLTVNDSSAVRIKMRSVNSDSGLERTTYRECLHLEKDLEYYNGDNATAIFNTDDSPGEGWIWKRLYPGEKVSAEFWITGFSESGQKDSLFARLRGISNDAISPDHHVQFVLNGILVGELSFDGFQEVVFGAEIPTGILEEGENRIEFRSVGDTGAEYDLVYLDWLQIHFDRRLIAQDGFLRFGLTQQPPGAGVALRAGGFSTEKPIVLRLPSYERLIDFPVAVREGKYEISFSDTLTGSAEYWVADSLAILRPARIERDKRSDLRNRSTGADYVIISHRKFFQQAQVLAQHRENHSGLQTTVIDVQDIMDEYNFGILNPLAIRDFLRDAVNTWPEKRPQFVVLFGDASWDYHGNLPNSSAVNYVPTYGNPVSDSRLVCLDGDDDFLPDLFVGRIPVSTEAEADAVVHKIISYDLQPPAAWQKNVIFLNGGFDPWEQNQFRTQSEKLITSYVVPPPFAGNPIRLYLQGREMAGMTARIRDAINEGALWLSFVGHAGSRTWDLMFNFPDIQFLSNSDRLPFISSMTCHTARFAEPNQMSFGEAFLLQPEAGAIAFWGTSGWGFIYQDAILLDQLFFLLLSQKVLSFGEATTLAKIALFDYLGYSPYNLSVLDQYVLLGDPAQRMAIPDQPDLTFEASSFRIEPEEPTNSDSLITVHANMLNLGIVTQDSVTVIFEILDGNNNRTVKTTRFQNTAFQVAITDSLSITGLQGDARLEMRLDPFDEINEYNETNNDHVFPFYIFSSTPEISFPNHHAVLPDDSLALVILTPAVAGDSTLFVFELDTLPDFNSPWRISSGEIHALPLVTKWQVPVDLPPGSYFWRCRMNENGKFSAWSVAKFYVDELPSVQGWREDFAWPVADFSLDRVTYSGDGVSLSLDSSRFVYLAVESGGYFDGKRCLLVINGRIVNQAGRGHHLVALDPASGNVIAGPVQFDTWADTTSADRMAAFIEGLAEGTVVLVGISDEGTRQMNERAYLALESLGSALCRQIQTRESWAMIGRKGASPGSVPEILKHVGESVAFVRDTLKNWLHREGTVSTPPIGPAREWEKATWKIAGIDSLTETELFLYGLNKENQKWELVQSSRNHATTISLADLPAKNFPFIRFDFVLKSMDAIHSPDLRFLQVEYDFAPDLALDRRLISIAKDSVLEGETVAVNVPIYNVGRTPSDSCHLQVDILNDSNQWMHVAGRLIPAVAPEDSILGKLSVPTTGYPGLRRMRVWVDANDQVNELSELNNQVQAKIYIAPDSLPPVLTVLVDGRTVLPGELVSPAPQFRIELRDNSPLPIADTTALQVFLDEMPIYYRGNQQRLRFQAVSENMLKAIVEFEPSLKQGEHTLLLRAFDASGNFFEEALDFVVENAFIIRDLLNVPNPFAEETDFCYVLTRPAEQVELRIFTLSGLEILRFSHLPGNTGFNFFHWNGRDADGDRLANGTYIFQIQAKAEGQTATATGKCVVLR